MKRIWLFLLCCCLLLAACTKKTETIEEPDTMPPLPEQVPQTEPVPDETDYAAELQTVFAGAAENPQDFEYEIKDGAATVTAYLGSGEAVRVPAELEGNPVTGIDSGVFADKENLKILVLPETVTVFGSNLFQNTALTALCTPLPGGVGFLGALWGIEESVGNLTPVLKSLQYLKLLSGGEETFRLPDGFLSDCKGLVALELPGGSELGTSALSNCEKLTYLNADALIKVGEKALDGCVSLQTLKFGTALSQMGFAALRNCRSLMELELPFIGESAQKQTGKPSERTDYLGFLFGAEKPAFSKGFYPTFLKTITILEGCAELPDFALYECVSLEALVLPSTLTRIGGRALSGCTALAELVLLDGCREIGDAACAGCTALVRVQMPSGITVGQNAFLDCPLKQ